MPLDQTPPDSGDQTNTAVPATGGLAPAEWLRLASTAYTGSTQYFDTAIRNDLVNDLRQFQGRHPTGSKYLSDAYRARSKFFRPKTRAAVRKNEAIGAAAWFATNDVISVKPIDDSNPLQRAAAALRKELLAYRLKKSIQWFLIAQGAYQDAQVQGVVCSYQCWMHNAKRGVDKPAIVLKPLENIRFDPNADWADPVGTSPYLIELIPMYCKDVKARMSDIIDGQPRWNPMSDAQLLQASSMNLDIVRQQRDAGRTDPRSKPTAITEYTIVWVHRNILEVDGEDYVFYTLGTVGMLDQPRRLSEVYYHGRRPYVIGFCAIETHRTYPSGPVRMGSEIQRELNENANQRSDNVKFALNKKWLVKRTAQVDLRSLQRNAPGSVTMVNDPGDGKDVRVIDTPDVTRSAYEEQDRLNLDFDDLVGNFSQSSVQANRKLNETVGGLNIINSNSNQITAYQLTCFVETWMEPVLEQLDALEQEYETDEEVLALAAKQAKLLEQYGINAVTDDLMMQEVIIDVNVGLAAVNPHDQVQNFIEALRALREILADGSLIAYGLDIGEAIKEIFGKLGYRDGRRFFPDDQDSRIKGLLATIEQLQAALKAKQPPEVIAAQVAKLRAEADEITARKVKTGVDSSFAAVQTAEVIATVPRVAPVADAVLQAAGYRPPQPPGVDPNLPDPGLQAPTTGPAMQQPESGVPRNTSPTMPPRPQAPASPEVGARQGIETQRADSEGP